MIRPGSGGSNKSHASDMSHTSKVSKKFLAKPIEPPKPAETNIKDAILSNFKQRIISKATPAPPALV